MKDTPAGEGAAFCLACGYEATQVEIDKGIQACPGCGSQGIPGFRKDDVTIKINWQELRILIMWAEFWTDSKINPDAQTEQEFAEAKAMKRLIYTITDRIHQQHLGKDSPLTFQGELSQVREHYPDMEVFGFGDEQKNV